MRVAPFDAGGPTVRWTSGDVPQKKQADLVLSAEIDMSLHVPAETRSSSMWSGGTSIEFKGTCQIGGTISLVLWEPLSNQRLWSKSVDIPVESTDCTVPPGSEESVGIQFTNKVSRAIEKAFPVIMRTFEKYFSPEEMALVKQQSKELREKKVY